MVRALGFSIRPLLLTRASNSVDDDKKNMRGERDLRWLMEMCKEKDKELESVLSHAADASANCL